MSAHPLEPLLLPPLLLDDVEPPPAQPLLDPPLDVPLDPPEDDEVEPPPLLLVLPLLLLDVPPEDDEVEPLLLPPLLLPDVPPLDDEEVEPLLPPLLPLDVPPEDEEVEPPLLLPLAVWREEVEPRSSSMVSAAQPARAPSEVRSARTRKTLRRRGPMTRVRGDVWIDMRRLRSVRCAAASATALRLGGFPRSPGDP